MVVPGRQGAFATSGVKKSNDAVVFVENGQRAEAFRFHHLADSIRIIIRPTKIKFGVHEGTNTVVGRVGTGVFVWSEAR